jgi:hypothetical protein
MRRFDEVNKEAKARRAAVTGKAVRRFTDETKRNPTTEPCGRSPIQLKEMTGSDEATIAAL